MTWFTQTKYCNIYALKKQQQNKQKISRFSVHFQFFLLLFSFTDGLIANILLGIKSLKSVEFNAHEI